MRVLENITSVKNVIRSEKARGARIGLVPTMGFLHVGHMSLIERCVKENDITIVSTFVNPAQFGPNMDFDRYPRNIDKDRAMLIDASVNYVFHPSIEEIYPHGYNTWVEVEKITNLLDGASRPGYFRGICTVVLKLFNITMCDTTYFGQKDIQQALTIKKLITDLNLDIDLTIMPIIRESDGLAMSSRNEYLNPKDRKTATVIYKGLSTAKNMFFQGEYRASELIRAVRDVLTTEKNIHIDYVDVVDMDEMQRLDNTGDICCIAVAVNLNGTRLIDNIILEKQVE